MLELPLNQVTTTSSVEGWDVDAYYGPVVSSMVVGAGLVTEFFAGFTDVFGGRSLSLANRLGELYRDASLELRRKASHLGANWILGYRVDFDEISGKGTFMLMLTATGTAVHATRRSAAPLREQASALISATEVAAISRRLELVKSEEPWISESNWQFAVENRIADLAPAAVAWLGKVYKTDYADPSQRVQLRIKPARLLAAIPSETAIEVLYDALNGDDQLAAAAVDLMEDLSLMDLSRTRTLVAQGDTRARRLALQTLRAAQPVYSVESRPVVEELIGLISKSYASVVATKELKGLLGTKRVWICLCGNENDEKQGTKCSSCVRDKRGFGPSDVSPERARTILQTLDEALLEAFQPAPSGLT